MMPAINKYGGMTSHATFCPYGPTQGICCGESGVGKGILEEAFQIVGLNVSKAFEYIPTLNTSMTN